MNYMPMSLCDEMRKNKPEEAKSSRNDSDRGPIQSNPGVWGPIPPALAKRIKQISRWEYLAFGHKNMCIYSRVCLAR